MYESDIFSNEHLYDYGLLYGNYPVYQETELCLSKFSEQYTKQINTPFVPEPAFGDPSKEYTGLMDVHMAYDCYSVEVLSDGTVYDDGNYAFPLGAIPVSTFVNIGSAGVYCKCWNLFWGCSRSFEVNGKEHSLFRSALLACKQSELPVGKEFYTIHHAPERSRRHHTSRFTPGFPAGQLFSYDSPRKKEGVSYFAPI